MIEPVGLAAGQFALQCVGGWWWDWLKRRRLATAYRASAEETIDCVLEGYPATSAVWNSVTSLLGSVERARQVARWYTQGISSNELQDMDKGDPAVGRFIGDFIVRLNDRRADLLTTDQSNLADVISERVALLVQQATPGTAQKAARISYWVDLPPSLGEKFVGRRSDFDALAGAFETSRAVVISGGAGTGKSRLAAEYARWAGADGFWTAAGANASQTLVALAKSLGVPIQDGSDADTATEVQRRLSELPRETLWVVDNVHDLGLVNELSSAVGLVRLLLTTRDARRNLLPPTVAFRAIAVIDPGAAIDLLCSRPRPESSWDSQDPSLREIAELVGRFPLALEMLAVRLGATRQTPERILVELKTAPTPIELKAFKEAAGATIHRVEGVFATIAGTLTDLPAELREQFAPLGYVADEPIPDTLLGALTGLAREEMDRLVEECSGRLIFSLVNEQVVVHALTIAAIAATNENGALSTTLIRAHVRLSSIALDDPRVLRTEAAHYQTILNQSGKTLDPEAAEVLSFSNNLAAGYRALGRDGEAAKLDEENVP